MFCYSAFRRRLLAFTFLQPQERPCLTLSLSPSLAPLIIIFAKIDILSRYIVTSGRINCDGADFRKYTERTRGRDTRRSVTVKITRRNVPQEMQNSEIIFIRVSPAGVSRGMEGRELQLQICFMSYSEQRRYLLPPYFLIM